MERAEYGQDRVLYPVVVNHENQTEFMGVLGAEQRSVGDRW